MSTGMMSGDDTFQADFTFANYCLLLDLAKKHYQFVTPEDAIRDDNRCVLWRHDVDLSLNRAVRLAEAEASRGIVATYFLNPHAEFYNVLELGQFEKVKRLIALGHRIGLHFDPHFYAIQSEERLSSLVAKEAAWLREWFDVDIAAFSFHNPTDAVLACDQEHYGGLVNCYSQRFRRDFGYCSDSNGYWRYRRLCDVLAEGADYRLQVLTHPGLWQEEQIPARSRVFRCIYGRAEQVLLSYDTILEDAARRNVAGEDANCRFLKRFDPPSYRLCDYLWNTRRLEALLLELWRLHERQINRLCEAMFLNEWHVTEAETAAFFDGSARALSGPALFRAVFGETWAVAAESCEETYQAWSALWNDVIHGRESVGHKQLELGCVALCGALERLAKWGQSNSSIRYDGLSDPTGVSQIEANGVASAATCISAQSTHKGAAFPNRQWLDFLGAIAGSKASEVKEQR